MSSTLLFIHPKLGKFNLIILKTSSLTVQDSDNLIFTNHFNRNAMSLEMLTELSAVFQEVNSSPDIRCVLLSSSGNVFSAGHNLKELVIVTVINFSVLFLTCFKNQRQKKGGQLTIKQFSLCAPNSWNFSLIVRFPSSPK